MPNHIHGIIIIEDTDHKTNIVGADLCVCPKEFARSAKDENIEKGAHTGAPLQEIIQWFKTMTTNEYIRGVKKHGWKPFSGKFWQRGYYEHVVRNSKELDLIREYIITNPARWAYDRENPDIKKIS